jgi:response regulator RpfG family c-di-GMP phosphodiesterase
VTTTASASRLTTPNPAVERPDRVALDLAVRSHVYQRPTSKATALHDAETMDQRPLVPVVDDDITTCALALAYLQLEGDRVKTAVNGVEATAVLRDCVPCVMVVDLRMPVMDGAELRRQQLATAAVSSSPSPLTTNSRRTRSPLRSRSPLVRSGRWA